MGIYLENQDLGIIGDRGGKIKPPNSNQRPSQWTTNLEDTDKDVVLAYLTSTCKSCGPPRISWDRMRVIPWYVLAGWTTVPPRPSPGYPIGS